MAEVDILLVEDNHGDTHLIERAFEDRALSGTLHTVQTGEEALDWLHRRDEFAGATRPDLILLDLNLPAMSGHEVLEEIKSDSRLKRIPVIVLTGSRSDEELVEVYERHANAAMIKPVDPEEFAELLRRFSEFWAAAVALPPGADPVDDR